MEDEKLVSVIVPIYNAEAWISECAESIIGQTYKKLDIILIDDGSTDASGKICDEFAEKDARIRVFHNTNHGVAYGRQFGIDHSAGELIAFVDADDSVHREYIAYMSKLMKQNGADIAMCMPKNMALICKGEKELPIEQVVKQSVIRYPEQVYGTTDLMSLLAEHYSTRLIVPCCKLYKKSLFSGVKYPAGKNNDDEFVIHRLFGKCKTAYISNAMLYFVRLTPDSQTRGKFSAKKLCALDALTDRINYYKKHFPTINLYNVKLNYLCLFTRLTSAAIDASVKLKRAKIVKYKNLFRQYLISIFKDKRFFENYSKKQAVAALLYCRI